MANREYYDLIIIGGGPGGLSAAIYALRASMRTVLIEKAAPGGQVTQSDAVENYPAIKNINGYELAQQFLDHAAEYNLEVLSQEVLAFEPGLEHHTVRLDSQEGLKAHAVILATGGSPRKLNIPGEDEYFGFDPNNQLVPAGTKINADGYVVTDDKCETNINGIFAIGDLREKYARQIVLSAADGCTAALASAHYVEIKRAQSE